MPSTDVPIVDLAAISREQLMALFAQGSPLIVKGIPGVDTWSLDLLRRTFGDARFETGCSAHNRAKPDKRSWHTLEFKRMARFNRYAEMLTDGTAERYGAYMAQIPLSAELIAKLPDVSAVTEKLPKSEGADYNLWCGPGGVVSDLHYDQDEGFLIQIIGDKQVTMVPPAQSPNLYAFPRGYAIASHHSQLDNIDDPDLGSFPRVAEALPHRHHFTLRAGQALFIPRGWWHKVVSLGTGPILSLSRWFNLTPTPLAEPTPSDLPAQPPPGVHGRVMMREATVDASVARVLAALTDEAAIRRWWNTTFHETAGVGTAEFTFMSKPVTLSVRIAPAADGASWSFVSPAEHWVLPWGGTTVRLTVAPLGSDQTSVAVRHDGWSAAAGPAHLGIAAGLWGHFLESLKRDLETGDGLAWGEW